MSVPRCQFRWWRPGGFRWPLLARATNGRWGLGRWTQAELDRIHAQAAVEAQAILDIFPADNSHISREIW